MAASSLPYSSGLKLSLDQISANSVRAFLAQELGFNFTGSVHLGLYSDVHEAKIHGQNLAVSIIGGFMIDDGAEACSHSLSHLDLVTLRMGEELGLPGIPKLLGEITSKEGNLVSLIMESVPGRKEKQTLADLLRQDDFDSDKAISDIRKLFEAWWSKGMQTWDLSASDLGQLSDSTWKLINPGALMKTDAFEIEQQLQVLFGPRY